MKKLLILLLVNFLLMPFHILAKCSEESIKEFRNEYKDETFDINYYSSYEIDSKKVHGYYIIDAKNIPDMYKVELSNDIQTYKVFKDFPKAIIPGGIYNVAITRMYGCPYVAKTFDIYLPEYNSNTETATNNVINKNGKSLNTLIILILLIILVSFIILITIKKQQKTKSINVRIFIFIVFLSTFIGFINVNAACSCVGRDDSDYNSNNLSSFKVYNSSFDARGIGKGKIAEVDEFNLNNGILNIKGAAYIKGINNFTIDSNYCYCSTGGTEFSGTFHKNVKYRFRFFKLDSTGKESGETVEIPESNIKYINRYDLFTDVCDLASNGRCHIKRSTNDLTTYETKYGTGVFGYDHATLNVIDAQHYRGGYSIENYDLKNVYDALGAGEYKLKVSIAVTGKNRCSDGSIKDYDYHWDDVSSEIYNRGSIDFDYYEDWNESYVDECLSTPGSPWYKSTNWVDVDMYKTQSEIDAFNNNNSDIKISVDNQAISIVKNYHVFDASGDRCNTYFPDPVGSPPSNKIFKIKDYQSPTTFDVKGGGKGSKFYKLGSHNGCIGPTAFSGTAKNIWVSQAAIQHNGYIKFTLKDNNNVQPKTCDTLGEGYEEIYRKDLTDVSQVRSKYDGTYFYNDLEAVCASSDESYYRRIVNTHEKTYYDYSSIATPSNSSNYNLDDLKVLANYFKNNGGGKDYNDKFYVEPEPTFTLLNSSSYSLKFNFINRMRKTDTLIDGSGICHGNLPALTRINFSPNIEILFCAKKKEVPVCVNTTNNMKCGDGTTVTENKKGEAAYHESNDYNMCILKAQKDSGFKIVKANGKSTSDNTDMIEKDNIAKTNKNSRYCVVACRDEVDFELPNLKEAFIGSKFELNLSRNGEEATTGPTIKYKRYCVTSRIKEQAFKQDIEAQSLKVQQLYEEYRDLRYIWKHLKVESYNRTSSYHCTSHDPETGACTGGHYDCDYTWKIAQYGSIPNGSDGKLNATGEASLSTITNFTGQDGSYTGCPDSACSSSPWLDSSMDNSKPKIEAEFKKKMDDKWIEYEEAKEEQDLMAKEISNCYTWMKDDKLYTSAPAAPGINYNYDDEASEYVRGEMIPKKVTIPGVVEEQFCYKNIYNDLYCNNGYHYSTTSNYYADCHNEDDASEDRCYRAYGSNPSHTPLYYNYFKIASSINLPNAYEYVKRIETKKWKYEIDPLTSTVYTNKKGEYTKGADKNSLDEYPAGYNTKLTGYNVSPIAMKTIAKDGYNYTLKYSKLDDKTRKKYTSDVGDNELTLENKTTKYNVYNTNNSKYTCKYNIKADGSTTPPGTPVVTPPGSPGTTPSGNHINFFYRTINVENINPTSRMLGYNWSAGASSNVVRSDLKDIIAETGDYQKLIGNTAKSGTGVADSRSDSITFRLTPALMENIRKNYNGTHNYSDYTEMKCSNTNSKTKFYCKSEFLECLTGQKHGGICDELEENLLTDVADGNNLNNFRAIVKAKNEKYIN